MTAARGSILVFATRSGAIIATVISRTTKDTKLHQALFLFPLCSFVSFVVNAGDRGIDGSRNRRRSCRNLIRYFFNFVYFFIAQAQLARPHHAIRLPRVPRPDDRSGHSRVA
jgi:hypothetical protein